MTLAANNSWFRALRRVAPYAVSLAISCAMLVWVRGTNTYSATKQFGGMEPELTHRAALEIVATGRTSMTYHPTGYSYLVALVYLFLPRVPLSVLWVQVASLPLVVWCVGQITGFFGGPRWTRWGVWAAAVYYPLGYDAAVFTSIYPALVFTMLALVALLPALGPRRSWWMSLLAGAALGVVACTRPNFAFLGVVFVLAIWRATGSLREALVRSVPIAATSLGLLGLMTALNPPEPGELTRGSETMSRGLLEGTYEYLYRWWDWDWMESSTDRAFREYNEHLKRIEQETGKSFIDPVSQPVVRREAWRRIRENPAGALKKAAISTVRVWINIPTHLNSMAIKIACAVQDFVLLVFALAGLCLLDPSCGRRVLAIGVMAVPTMTHWLSHVEPRYSLPGKGVELALAVVAVAALAERLRIVKPAAVTASAAPHAQELEPAR